MRVGRKYVGDPRDVKLQESNRLSESIGYRMAGHVSKEMTVQILKNKECVGHMGETSCVEHVMEAEALAEGFKG